MFSNALVKIDNVEANPILEDINTVLEGAKFNPEKAVLLGQYIPFYEGYRYFDVSDFESVPNRQRFVVYKPGHVVVLDWTNEPLYQLNEKAPIKLTDSNVADYARFFFMHVRGRHGRFLLVDSVDDIRWREEPPPVVRKAVGNMIQPVQILSDDGAQYVLSSCMIFKDALFKAKINVSREGIVNMFDEELLIEDMPVLDDVLGQ